MIYGAGNIGKLLYEKLKGRTNIRAFIDLYSNEINYKGTPIINEDQVSEFIAKSGKHVIVSSVDELDSDSIKKLCPSNVDIEILKIDDLFYIK